MGLLLSGATSEFDRMGVRVGEDDWWEVFIRTNSNDNKNFQRVQVACVDDPFEYQINQGSRQEVDDDGDIRNVSNKRSPSVLWDPESDAGSGNLRSGLYSTSGFSH